jgi:CRP-like cAMP-binding protein
LHGVPLFARLAPDDLEELSRLTRERRFAADEALCVEGDEGRDVFVLVEGRARAWVRGPDGSPRTLGESGPGDCIGEMAALDEAPRTATVTAMVDGRAMVLSGAAFNELLAERPEMAREMVRVLSGRLRGMIAVRNAS